MEFNNSFKIAWICKKDKNTSWKKYTIPISFSNKYYAILCWQFYHGQTSAGYTVIQIQDSSSMPKTQSSIYMGQDTSYTPISGITIVFLGY